MPRVVGVDPGTVSIDVCGLDDGRLVIDRSWATADALADPESFVASLQSAGPVDLVAGPSGYGLPLIRASAAGDDDLRLAFLAAPGEVGGIGGLRRLAGVLARSGLPVVYTPGVIHLDTVPAHRKLNRIDLGTADKLATAALGIAEQSARLGCSPAEASFILLELGGAFTAALAVDQGRVVDGLGGTSGPIGWRACGALDAEVAYLAGEVSKAMLFRGGAGFVAEQQPPRREAALDALAEGAIKAVRSLLAALPAPREILLTGRTLTEPGVAQRLEPGLRGIAPVRRLEGLAKIAKSAAQGAAILADGLAGGAFQPLVERMRLHAASGTVLDHLAVISPAAARQRLGIAP
jgi:predicted butyrate kinase (DUF1464 family)